MRDTRRYLAPQDQEAVLHEAAAMLLAEEGQSVPDWEIVGPQIAAEIGRQSASFSPMRGLITTPSRGCVRGPTRLRAPTPLCAGWPGPWPDTCSWLSRGRSSCRLAAANPGLGLTPLILAILAVALGIRWALWRRRRAALMRSVPVAYQHWIDVLRDSGAAAIHRGEAQR